MNYVVNYGQLVCYKTGHLHVLRTPYLIRYYFDDQRAKLGYLLAVFGDAFARRTPALGSVVRL